MNSYTLFGDGPLNFVDMLFTPAMSSGEEPAPPPTQPSPWPPARAITKAATSSDTDMPYFPTFRPSTPVTTQQAPTSPPPTQHFGLVETDVPSARCRYIGGRVSTLSPVSEEGGRRSLSNSSGGSGDSVSRNFYCAFCKKNGETKEYYTTHKLKDPKGKVICPVLRAYTCPLCGQTGEWAHTESHCPLAGGGQSVVSSLRTRRTSCGARRPTHKKN
ncbi:hypothetical protein BaRGS_00016762 [Batillaria attramentaria]|uniref:Nanos-type domain-containing protein n=1 Tax=Batillaria attramentaria TaxID=370345 RepID=A0ABD0KY17_9CAEN